MLFFLLCLPSFFPPSALNDLAGPSTGLLAFWPEKHIPFPILCSKFIFCHLQEYDRKKGFWEVGDLSFYYFDLLNIFFFLLAHWQWRTPPPPKQPMGSNLHTYICHLMFKHVNVVHTHACHMHTYIYPHVHSVWKHRGRTIFFFFFEWRGWGGSMSRGRTAGRWLG